MTRRQTPKHDPELVPRTDLIDELTGDVSRRSFLRLVGFGVSAAALAGCSRGPVSLAIPYLDPPEDIVPGRAYQIATTSTACGAGCGVLATCRDGRPIKLEGNPDHPVSRGGLCPVCQASLLSLYDSHRYQQPQLRGAASAWTEVDAFVADRLDAARGSGGAVRLLTGTIHSPSTRAQIRHWLAAQPNAEHVMYDALSASATRQAHLDTHGVRAVPRVDLSKARVIASFDADFLATGVSPVEHAVGWAAGRRFDDEAPSASRLWQFEARMSPTGARADRRVRLAPWETGAALWALVADLGRRAGQPLSLPDGADDPAGTLSNAALEAIATLADELWAARGSGVVLCGTNAQALQVLVNRANDLLGAYGSILDLRRPSQQRLGDDAAVAALRAELEAGEVELLLVAGANPAFDLPGFAAALEQAGTVVTCAPLEDETSLLADAVCPEPHDLERWDDAEPVAGVFALQQPTLPPLRDARTLRASLAAWSGDTRDDRTRLREYWRAELFPRRSAQQGDFDAFFDATLERGFVELPSGAVTNPSTFRTAALQRPGLAQLAAEAPAELAVVLHPRIAMLDGRGAQNPWLQELPDPITKSTWGNEASLSPATAERLGLADGDVVRLQTDDEGLSLELPVLTQPGQHDGVVAVALGYGRHGTDRFTNVGPEWMFGRRTVESGDVIGRNAAPWMLLSEKGLRADRRTAQLAATGEHVELARTQDHHRLEVPEHLAPAGGEVRDAVHTLAFADGAFHAEGAHAAGHQATGDLWPEDHPREGHAWALAIDLAACTGCSACVVSCQAENNVPVVGRDEVRRHREMSWLRIDRYYQGHDDDLSVSHQPMMCQHCDHAPCETVCPVLATVHSSEGLNTQVYNRCVGTRYCANNCPYKVRRFNWFDYPREDALQNLALNPDVTVRSRGVMEKCSMCVQRIQAGKQRASRDGAELADGDIEVACQQSCPTRAISFGDLNDPESDVARKLSTRRSYVVLEELNVRPSVRYLADVRHARPEGVRHG